MGLKKQLIEIALTPSLPSTPSCPPTQVSLLGGAHHPRDGARQVFPLGLLERELLAAGGGQVVELHLAAALGRFPFGGDPALAVQLVERGIEGAVLHRQDFVGGALNVLGDAVAVHGPNSSVRRIIMSSVPCRSSTRL